METYFVDSNVFFYAKIMDKEYGAACARVLNMTVEGRFKAVTSSLAIVELANALRKYGLSNEVTDVVDAVFSLDIQIFEVDPLDVREAVAIFDRFKVSPYDCTHAATMRKAGTDKLISADRDFEKIAWIKRMDPKDFPLSGT